MSFALQQAAWNLLPGELSPQERVVLLALAEDCRTGRDVASPGHKLLTERTGLRRTQLSTTIARLVSRGLVLLAEKARRGKNAVYRLLFAPVDNQAPVPGTRTQSSPPDTTTGTDHEVESVRPAGMVPGTCSSPRKNITARAARVVGNIAKSKSAPKVDYSATPWRAPSNAPTNPLKPSPRPDLSSLPVPPEWAIEAARTQLGRFAGRHAVLAVAREIAAEAVSARQGP